MIGVSGLLGAIVNGRFLKKNRKYKTVLGFFLGVIILFVALIFVLLLVQFHN